MLTTYVHILGDSTLDNLYWLLNGEGTNLEEAYKQSVEGQLQQQLNNAFIHSYKVMSGAYAGFTTTSVLQGGQIGNKFGITTKQFLSPQQKNYCLGKRVDKKVWDRLPIQSNAYDKKPLDEMNWDVGYKSTKSRHYVVLGVGGHELYESIPHPLALLRDIPKIRERYFAILDQVRKSSNVLRERVWPIIVLPYQLDASEGRDTDGVYTSLKVAGVVALTLQALLLVGIPMVLGLAGVGKIHRLAAVIFSVVGGLLCKLLHNYVPLEVGKRVLLRGEKIGVVMLGRLLENLYRPILAKAQEYKIPVLDLSNSFSPLEDHYISQTALNQKASTTIAAGIVTIIKDIQDNGSEWNLYTYGQTGWTGASLNPSEWKVQSWSTAKKK